MERKKKGRYGNCNGIPSQFIPSLSLLHLSHFFFHLFPLGMKTLPSITICVSVCVCERERVCVSRCMCVFVRVWSFDSYWHKENEENRS
jgi:hypothetical protein